MSSSIVVLGTVTLTRHCSLSPTPRGAVHVISVLFPKATLQPVAVYTMSNLPSTRRVYVTATSASVEWSTSPKFLPLRVTVVPVSQLSSSGKTFVISTSFTFSTFMVMFLASDVFFAPTPSPPPPSVA